MKKIKKLAKILISLTDDKSEKEKEEIIKFFLVILRQRKKIHLAKQILRELGREKRKKEVMLNFARKLDEKIVAEIKEKLKGLFGKEKEFKIKIQEELIGGFLAKSQNYLIDASIKGLINKLRTHGNV
jgi:F0F1-type ATP synthase delta subunit